MKSVFEIYFTVKFTHTYYESGSYKGVSVIADSETKIVMNNNGLLLKYQEDGFFVLFDKYHAGTERTKKDLDASQLNLRFLLVLKDNFFYNYTDIASVFINYQQQKEVIQLLKKDISLFRIVIRKLDINENCFLFKNYNNALSFKDGYVLHRSAFANKNDFSTISKSSKKIFGEIFFEISVGFKYIFYIRFVSKKTRWNYILSSSYLKEIINPIILDDAGDEEFLIPAVVKVLNKDVIIITSKNALLLSQYSKYYFKLVQDYNKETGRYKTIKSRLPVPNIQNISNACAYINDQGLEYSDIFL